MKNLWAKIVPKLFNLEQKVKNFDCYEDWLESEEITGDFLNRVITGDDSWL